MLWLPISLSLKDFCLVERGTVRSLSPVDAPWGSGVRLLACLLELPVAGVRRLAGLLAGVGELGDEVRVVLDVARGRTSGDLLQDVARQVGLDPALVVLPKDGARRGVNAHALRGRRA